MPAVSYTKLYADLVAPDGTVCIVYASWLSVLGLRFFLGGVETYLPRGERTVERASYGMVTPSPQRVLRNALHPEEAGTEDLLVEIGLPSGPFVLALSRIAPSPLPGRPLPGMTWAVLAARADAEARWTAGSRCGRLTGLGYADWVTVDRPARRYPLRKLEWGRIHLASDTALFTRLTLRDGRTWERGLVLPAEARRGVVAAYKDSDYVQAHWHNGDLQVDATPAAGSRSYRLRPYRQLHAGGIADHDRFPRPLERAAVRAFAGPSRETRWLSYAEGMPPRTDRGWAVHEEVLFGQEVRTVVPTGTTQSEPTDVLDPYPTTS